MPSGVYQRTKSHQVIFFQKGHIPWNKGKKMSDKLRSELSKKMKILMNKPLMKQKIKNGLSKRTLLQKQQQVEKRKISMKKYLDDTDYHKKISMTTKSAMSRPEVRIKLLGSNNPMYGKKQSKEQILNRFKWLIPNSGIKHPRKGVKLPQWQIDKLLEGKRNSKNRFASKPEKMLQIALALEGIKSIPQKYFRIGNTWHAVDLFISPNLCIEVDGVYWHSLPHKIDRDKVVESELKRKGYDVLRFKVPLKTKNFDVTKHAIQIHKVIQN